MQEDPLHVSEIKENSFSVTHILITQSTKEKQKQKQILLETTYFSATYTAHWIAKSKMELLVGIDLEHAIYNFKEKSRNCNSKENWE